MNARENLLSLLRRQGFEYIPCDFALCPSLEDEYRRQVGTKEHYVDHFHFPMRGIEDIRLKDLSTDKFLKYYPDGLKDGAKISLPASSRTTRLAPSRVPSSSMSLNRWSAA